MKLKDIITMVDDIKPNAFSNASKTGWINECEGLVQTEVMLIASEDIITYDYTEDQDTELLVRPPHDKIYWTYLTALIDFANGEYNKYQNTLQLFNQYFGEYMRWYALHYRPADGEAVAMGYYLSAYAIAVSHGYVGTEEEWIASLKGEKGDGFRFDGFYDTLTDLEEEITDPEIGDTYGVGTEAPYEIYIWDGEDWRDNGTLKGDKGDTGSQGPQGIQGIQGEKGDPFVYDDFTEEQLEALTGPQGETGPQGIQGIQGIQGVKGDKGDTGAVYTPSVSSAGVISWTNDGDLPNPESVNIKGPQGETGPKGDAFTYEDFTEEQLAALTGPQGIQGEKGDPFVYDDFTEEQLEGLTGPQGIQGIQGIQGVKGDKGDTGAVYTPAVSSAGVISWTNDGDLPNPESVNIKGPQGEKGDTGDDAPVITDISIRSSDYHLIITLEDGTTYDAGYCRGASGSGTGDMMASTYDPNGMNRDIFAYTDSKYSKPSTGIPKTDLASGVQDSLDLADTAIQTETDPTVPSWAKASSKPSYTASEVGAAPTSHASSATTYGAGTSSNYGHLKLSDSTSSTSGTSGGTAATPSAVKSAYDLANGKYSKPSGGIPKTDLASGVQDSLDLADSAIQTETDPTVPSWAKASSKPSYTASEVGAAPTSHASTGTTYGAGSSSNYGHLKLSDSTSSTSGTSGGTAATPSAVKAAYDLANGKYTKPSTGIPKTDLASGVQASLDLADSALQSYTETDPTVPSWAKASSKPSYTASEVGAAASTHAHGNITSGGDITATAPTIANGDQLVINDSSASKITNGPTFDGSTTSKYLSQKGTWESAPTVPSASTTTPSMDGTASYGSGTTWARADHVHPTDTSRAPTSHASTGTTYGAGTSSNYGHLKLSDSTSSTSGTTGGTAATPSAVKAAYDLANGKQDPLPSQTGNAGKVLTTNGTTLSWEEAAGGTSATVYDVTFLSSGWALDANGYYSQTVNVTGMLASYTIPPQADVILDGDDKDGDEALLEGFSYISYLNTGAGTLTAKCIGPAPAVNVPVRVVVFV